MSFQDPKYPVPTTVSPEAQAFLANPIDMSALGGARPETTEEWEAMIAGVDSQYLPILEEMLRVAPVTFEKSEVAGVTVRVITPDHFPADRQDKVLINLHGGGYAIMGGELSVMEGIPIAAAGGFKVICVDYRMPPHHPYPAAVDDGLAVYEAVLEHHKPGNVAIFGASAGGGLTAAVVLAARDKGLSLPAGVILNTPWSDLTKSGDSYYTNDGVDPVLTTYDGGLIGMAKIYAGDEDPKHPLLSPVYADYTKGFPPAMLVTGTRDLLLSCTVRLHRVLRAAGIYADLHVFEAMWHGFAAMPEGRVADAEAIDFLENHLGLK